MPQLSDPSQKNTYATYLNDIYQHFSKFSVIQRKAQFEGVVRIMAQAAGIPIPLMRWVNGQGGWFAYAQWELVMPEEAVTMDPQSMKIRDWLYYATTPYHEMRHCEQFFMMAQAVMTGALPIPSKIGTRGIVQGATVQQRGDGLSRTLGYPMHIVVRADQSKGGFQQSSIGLVRGWMESIFTGGSRARSQTYNHLKTGTAHMQRYINLAEETDAWNNEREVSRLFRSMVSDAGDEALDLSSLFG